MRIHISTSVRGLLKKTGNDFDRACVGLVGDDGKQLTPEEVRVGLLYELGKGHELIRAVGCDNFDPVKGCLGHPDRSEQKIEKLAEAEELK